MKRRTGFVSNSSSSSFVMIFRQDVTDKVLQEFNTLEKAIFKHHFSSSSLFGIPVYTREGFSVENSDYENTLCNYDEDVKRLICKQYEIGDEDWWDIAEKEESIIGSIESRIQKESGVGNYFYTSECC